jgi:hypothetical protein
MAKYRVNLTAPADLNITVEVPDGLSPEKARETAIEEACQKAPSQVCAQCSGWGSEYELELGEWKASGDAPEAED